jgi:hypothetical protein
MTEALIIIDIAANMSADPEALAGRIPADVLAEASHTDAGGLVAFTREGAEKFVAIRSTLADACDGPEADGWDVGAVIYV